MIIADIWEDVKKEQLDGWDLEKTEKDHWLSCSLEDVNKKLQELNEDHQRTSKVRELAGKLKDMIGCLSTIGPAFDVLVQVDPYGLRVRHGGV